MSKASEPTCARMLNDIINELDAARCRRGLTTPQWARRSGLSARCVKYTLGGRREPKISTLLRLAGGAGISLWVSVRKPERQPNAEQQHGA